MVSTVRYWSFKEVDFAQRRPLQTLLIIVLAVMIIARTRDLLVCGVLVLRASGPVRRLMVGRTEGDARGARAEGIQGGKPHE